MSKFRVNVKQTPTPHKQSAPRAKQTQKQGSSLSHLVQLARHDPQCLTPEQTLQLQRGIGNRATMQLIRPTEESRRSGHSQPIQRAVNWGQLKNKKIFSWSNLFGMSDERKKKIKNRRPKRSKNKNWRSRENQRVLPQAYIKQRKQEDREASQYYREVPLQNLKRFPRMIRRSETPLSSIMNHPLAFSIFKDYCDHEYGTENYIFLEMISSKPYLGGEKNLQGVRQMTMGEAQYLYDEFISTTSTFQVNIPSNSRMQIIEIMQNFKDEMDNISSPSRAFALNSAPISDSLRDALNEARQEVYYMLNDTLSRFSYSKKMRYMFNALAESGSHEVGTGYLDEYEKRKAKKMGKRSWSDFLFGTS